MYPRAFEETGILKPRASFPDFLYLYSILGRTDIYYRTLQGFIIRRADVEKEIRIRDCASLCFAHIFLFQRNLFQHEFVYKQEEEKSKQILLYDMCPKQRFKTWQHVNRRASWLTLSFICFSERTFDSFTTVIINQSFH